MTTPGLERIVQRASSHPSESFTALMHHYSVANLRANYQSLDNQKALGVDRVSKAEYGEDLDGNLQALHQNLCRMSYRPQAVRRVEIPKDDGSVRPQGISCTEDKIVQGLTRQILAAIYEPVFHAASYGFRPGRSCHDALRQLNREVMSRPVNWVVDIDLAKFFDTMPHEAILAVLRLRIQDPRFLRLIARMLKVGVETPAGTVYGEQGSPQGSIVSPVIANIFLDHVLDQWFETVVKQHCRGYCSFIRYADDVVTLFEREEDAQRFMRVLPRRLGKFGLSLNPDKTHLLAFGKRHARTCLGTGQKPSAFDFLGLTHYWGRSHNGYVRMKRKTSKKRLRRALKSINQWLKQVRNQLRLPLIWRIIGQKLRGHFNYYGVSDNSRCLSCFEQRVHDLLFKWLNRRSQKRSFSWESFLRYRAQHPLPQPGRLVSLY